MSNFKCPFAFHATYLTTRNFILFHCWKCFNTIFLGIEKKIGLKSLAIYNGS